MTDMKLRLATMVARIRRVAVVVVGSATVLLSCGGSDSAPADGAAVGSITVVVVDTPSDATGNLYFSVRYANGNSTRPEQRPRRPFESWTTQDIKSVPFDVVVQIPDEEAGGEVDGPGYYAVLSEWTTVPATLKVSRWQKEDSPPEEGADLVSAGEDSLPVSVQGVVLDPDGFGIAGVTVWSIAGGGAVTDVYGEFLMEMPVGPAVIEADYYSVSSGVMVDVPKTGLEGITLSIDPSEVVSTDPVPLTGRVIEAQANFNTEGSPVPEALVSFTTMSGEEFVTTDQDGRFEVYLPPGAFFATVNETNYAIHRQLIYSALGELTLKVFPLPQEMYGDWQYCHSVGQDGETFELDRAFPTNRSRVDNQTFRDDGTAEFYPELGGYWRSYRDEKSRHMISFLSTKNPHDTTWTWSIPTGGIWVEGDLLMQAENSASVEQISHHVFARSECPDLGSTSDGGPPPPDCEALLDEVRSLIDFLTGCMKSCNETLLSCLEQTQCQDIAACQSDSTNCASSCAAN